MLSHLPSQANAQDRLCNMLKNFPTYISLYIFKLPQHGKHTSIITGVAFAVKTNK